MRKEEDVVTAPVDMVTFIAENGICLQKQQFFLLISPLIVIYI